jgi:hypothetical protein
MDENRCEPRRVTPIKGTGVFLLIGLAFTGCGDGPSPLTGVVAVRKQAGPTPKRSKMPREELTREVGRLVESRVAAGFEKPEQVVQSALDVYSDDESPEVLRPIAQRLTDDALRKHQKAQLKWPSVTDCDRLDRAFQALESRGIVSRQNFSDCGTCGTAEIADEMEANRKDGKTVRGYTFYHQQDTESAVDGSGLYLNYGALEDEREPAQAIAREIVAELNRQGLKTTWDGTWEQRIHVALDWKRRGPS